MLTANCTPTRLMSVVEASEFFGMSKYSLRKGIKTGAMKLKRSVDLDAILGKGE